jgi:hypothetical protein
MGVDYAEHLASFGRDGRLGGLGPAVHLGVVIDEMTSCVGGDDDTVVADMQEAICRFDRDRLAGEVAADVVAVLEDADAPGPINAPAHGPGAWWRPLLDRDVAVDDQERSRLGELQASDRGDIAEGLVVSFVVVVLDPDIKGRLSLLDRLEAGLGEELLRMVLCKRSILPVVVGEE